MPNRNNLRKALIKVALEWEQSFCNAPSVTGSLAELDGALLLGCSIADYSAAMKGSTAVQKGFDFKWQGIRYQVKSNRPSGKKGSPVSKVGQAKNYDWDRLIWILYDRQYELVEAWIWSTEDYKAAFHEKSRLSPNDMRKGTRLFHRV